MPRPKPRVKLNCQTSWLADVSCPRGKRARPRPRVQPCDGGRANRSQKAGEGYETVESFTSRFAALTGHEPFPWQQALFGRLRAGEFPAVCRIPTGIGKTSAMAVWMLALAARAEADNLRGFPRRLVYVVNRRTVVDQATVDVEMWRHRMDARPELAEVRDAVARHARRSP
jgi:reverse gyrase